MKRIARHLVLTHLLSATRFAQDDITEIFDDLSDPTPPPAPTEASPQPAETATRMPLLETPILYRPETTAPTLLITEQEIPPLNIEKTIRRGKTAWHKGDFNQAQQFFEAVLYTDPHNPEAIRWLRRIAKKKTEREEKSYTTTRTRMLENVQAAWNTPKAEGLRPDSNPADREPTAAERKSEALQLKLQTLRIPTITFLDADIQQVIFELSGLCRELDGEGKGFNLVTLGTSETLLPTITFSGTDLSALETLDIITQMAGMKYDIGPSMVILTPVNYEPPQQMVSTEFDIIPSVGSKMSLQTGSQPGSTSLTDARDFFSTVPFPTGASAQYNPEFHILLVRNVPKHIDKIASLLEHYNRKAFDERSRQVEIETKFIEVAEGALDELGFEWTLGKPGTYLNDDRWSIPGGQKFFTDTLRTGEETFDPSISAGDRASSFSSYAGAAAASLADGLVGTAGELLIQKIKGNIQIDLLIRALERQEGSDLLSAPKVLTKSGKTATIHVGEIRYFPTAYDVIIERYAQPSLLPLDYEEYKTGVMLEVTPELDPENGTIDLKLSPEIRELAGFDEQHVGTLIPVEEFNLEYPDNAISSEWADLGKQYVGFLSFREEKLYADRLIARMPVFRTRKVETEVTIEDGSTIAMGGLIKEGIETFKDSVPILGRIPLLGRLFRSEGERSVKRNLLIFVTANQVDASGHRLGGREL